MVFVVDVALGFREEASVPNAQEYHLLLCIHDREGLHLGSFSVCNMLISTPSLFIFLDDKVSDMLSLSIWSYKD